MHKKINRNHEFSLPLIWRVAAHTDNVGKGSIFVAIQGTQYNGADFIVSAIQKGATHIVVHEDACLSQETLDVIKDNKAKLQRVSDTRLALAQLSAQAYAFPSKKLCIVGITGTKGKTTTAYLLHHILQKAGKKAALLSTVENRIGDYSFKAPLTTAQPDYLHMFFDACVEQDVTHVVMEVAAQAFSLHRVHGVQFDAGIFTNFAHEHLEFYASMDDYFAAKCQLFDHTKIDAPVFVNTDDQYLQHISFDSVYPLSLRDIEIVSTAPYISVRFQENVIVQVPHLMGVFNVYNILFAVRASVYFDVPIDVIQKALHTFEGVPGRLQEFKLKNDVRCFVDYAHTPDSYRHVLSLLREMTNYLIVVFGCGGQRDKSKRPLMGAVAAQYADVIILTNDNPRTEDPLSIVHDIQKGIEQQDTVQIHVELDRAAAIKTAINFAPKGAIVVVLGKGPDAYQIIGQERSFFSDAEQVQSFVEKFEAY